MPYRVALLTATAAAVEARTRADRREHTGQIRIRNRAVEGGRSLLIIGWSVDRGHPGPPKFEFISPSLVVLAAAGRQPDDYPDNSFGRLIASHRCQIG